MNYYGDVESLDGWRGWRNMLEHFHRVYSQAVQFCTDYKIPVPVGNDRDVIIAEARAEARAEYDRLLAAYQHPKSVERRLTAASRKLALKMVQ